MREFWQGRRILVGVCGGIAAYKTCQLVSALAQEEAQLRVILTGSGESFVSPLTFAALSRHSAYTDRDFWHYQSGRPLHIELAEWAEVILLTPLTANTLAKIALGLADNLLTNVLLASTSPVLLAPAMNTEMWKAPPVQRHWQDLLNNPRFWGLSPTRGRLACDSVGEGRMAEPAFLQAALFALLWTNGQKDWQGRCLLISGGGTRESIDRVRFIGNPASGKMGFALAEAAMLRGATVIWIHAGDPLPDIPGVMGHVVTTASEMHQALAEYFPQVDLLIMAAAVGDVRPRYPASGKLPKADLPLSLDLELIPDILQDLVSRKRPQQKVIGFAAQTGDPLPAALEKLTRKGLDAIVANPIDQPDAGFASSFNQGVWLTASGESQGIPYTSKQAMAHRILDLAGQLEKP
ncbi:MAG: bifunctional phosphopantothenoylcysteine decarboxylase/phosphopantothenate--cysteine ligase CoaBC [Cyanobacteriota bacterium]|nr:bifunctional phosphopantothenoylcysteine decarboxylase/phosphopantothenate--cysteine ligase CoaBC [Cyanobacteriota bacterium]